MSILHLLGPATLLLCCGALQARIWSDTSGRQLEAELVTADAATVTLRLANGTTSVVSQETLSGVDTVYVKEWLKKNPPKPGAKPAASPKPVPADKPVTPGPTTKPPIGLAKDTDPAAPVGFDGPWPKEAVVPEDLGIEVVKEDDATKKYIYRSRHFEFSSNVQLRPALVNTMAKVFETTHEFLRVLPLNHRTTARSDKHFPVILYEHYEQYLQAGGRNGSSGHCRFSSSDAVGEIHVPLRSLGAKRTGKDFTIDSGDRDFSTLSHEITHQIMEHVVMQAYWYVEGSAEYIANTHYHSGRFQAASNKSWIIAFVTGYGKDGDGGRALGKKIKMPHLQKFMEMDQPAFLSNARLNYGLGCLFTLFFYHLDGKGDAARIKEYLKALQAGVPEVKAREKLLDGRTYEQLELEFAAAMSRSGVKIEYKD